MTDSPDLSNNIAGRLSIFVLLGVIVALLATQEINAGSFLVDGRLYRTVPDDVMITFRTAYNLAHGNGPYFNTDEAIAANTSLLWPIAIAPVFRVVDLDNSVLVLELVSVGLTLLTLFAVVYASRTLPAALAVGTAFVLSPSLQMYWASAWEHIPQMLVITVGMLLSFRARDPERRLVQASLCFGAGFLLRPDTLPIVAPMLALRLIGALRSRSRASMIALGVMGMAVALYFVGHLALYSSIVPNTYYLKATGGGRSLTTGISYLQRSVWDGGNTALLLAVLLVWMWTRRCWTLAENMCIAGIGLFVVYVVSIGGDYFSGGRFLLCVTPLAVFLSVNKLVDAHATGLLNGWRGRLTCAGLVAAAIWICLLFLHSRVLDAARVDYGRNSESVQIAVRRPDNVASQVAFVPLIRAAIQPSDGDLALFTLGSVSYYLPEFHITDFLGKADSVISRRQAKWGPIAHMKWDLDYSFTQRRIAVAVVLSTAREDAARIVAERRDFSFLSEIFLNSYVVRDFTYLSPAELGYRHPWGLLVRNDLVEKFRAVVPIRQH